jgi:hypothetical protein
VRPLEQLVIDPEQLEQQLEQQLVLPGRVLAAQGEEFVVELPL